MGAGERSPALPGGTDPFGGGLLFLLGNFAWFYWFRWERFWPVILVIFGLFLRSIAGGLGHGRSPAERGLIGPLLLIFIGVLLLLQTLGVLSWDVWLQIWRSGRGADPRGHPLLFGREQPVLGAVLSLLLVAVALAYVCLDRRLRTPSSLEPKRSGDRASPNRSRCHWNRPRPPT